MVRRDTRVRGAHALRARFTLYLDCSIARHATLRKDEIMLREEAREYDRIFCGREKEGKDWTDDKALLRTFCAACEDQSERCDNNVRGGDVTKIKTSGIPNTAPHFIPTFLGILLFSLVVAFGLYYSSSSYS